MSGDYLPRIIYDWNTLSAFTAVKVHGNEEDRKQLPSDALVMSICRICFTAIACITALFTVKSFFSCSYKSLFMKATILVATHEAFCLTRNISNKIAPIESEEIELEKSGLLAGLMQKFKNNLDSVSPKFSSIAPIDQITRGTLLKPIYCLIPPTMTRKYLPMFYPTEVESGSGTEKPVNDE